MKQKRGIAFILTAIFLVLYYALVCERFGAMIPELLALVAAPICCIIGFILVMMKD